MQFHADKGNTPLTCVRKLFDYFHITSIFHSVFAYCVCEVRVFYLLLVMNGRELEPQTFHNEIL